MYQLKFESGGVEIHKTAKNEKEVRRLVYLYTLGSQAEKEAKIKEILTDTLEFEQLINHNKKERNGNL